MNKLRLFPMLFIGLVLASAMTSCSNDDDDLPQEDDSWKTCSLKEYFVGTWTGVSQLAVPGIYYNETYKFNSDGSCTYVSERINNIYIYGYTVPSGYNMKGTFTVNNDSSYVVLKLSTDTVGESYMSWQTPTRVERLSKMQMVLTDVKDTLTRMN